MIVLFEENEKSFSTLGLGVLKDATSCVVKEKLNDEFSLTMEYPVKGGNFSKIKNNRIICVKPNPYTEPQAFRIYSITKAINGKVIVDANHISYDMNSIPVKAFSAKNMQDVLVQIQNGCVVDSPFVLSSDILRSKTYKTTAPYNLRALIMGSDQSVVTEYDAELEFDNYVVKILAKRGKNRGAVVRYGHNMTDINHVLSTDLLYNGVFPYYHTERTTTETKTSGEFQQVYIVGSKTFQDGWLSYSKDGEPYHPIDESPVQIATEGEYYQKVYAWNTLYNVYQEKIYNEQVTIIQGLTEPSWLSIDWSHFPNVIVKAARKGYYKKATDSDWGEIKGVGDVVYEGSIVSSGLMENLILSFSEVVPSNSTSSNEEVSEIVDVQLDQPIIWLETNDAKSMLHDRILMLDLTSEFEEEPSQINLRAKAEEYINKHKIGTIKHSTTLSFIDMSSTKEGSRFENLDHVELGDTVKVVYEDAGIEVDLRVISAEYDALSERYNSIELGEKEDKMSDSTIQNGDNVSALTNDAGYATVTTVNKLIANIVTANYIEALNAKLSSAQISQLAVERINCTGIIEASQFAIDSLVAKLLIADNAEIAETLTAGNIKVAGDISVNSGQITITSENGTSFVVDREGNLTANSVSITGGNLNINDGVFEVTNDGVLTALAADITGAIRAKEGEIAGFVIQERQLNYGAIGSSGSVVVSPGIEAEIASLVSGNKMWAFVASGQFGVTTSGTLYAKQAVIDGSITATSGNIAGFTITQYDIHSDYVTISPNKLSYGDGFSVTSEGKVTITKGNLEIQNGVYTVIELTSEDYEPSRYYTKNIFGDYILSTGEFNPDAVYYQYDSTKTFFGVDSNGNVTANSVKITGGELTIGQSYGTPIFSVDQTGTLTAKNAFISGGVLNVINGEILLGGSYEYAYRQIDLSGGTGRYTWVYLNSETYEPNKYYTRDASTTPPTYNLETGPYDSEKIYWRYWTDSYEPNTYYILKDGIYVLSTASEMDPNETYYEYNGGAAFYVRHDGHVEARDLTISGGSIRILDLSGSNTSFEVTNDGALTATNATITGAINAESGRIGTVTSYFDIGGNDISNTAYIKSGVTSFSDDQNNGVYIGTDGIRLGPNFAVDNQGNVTANTIVWTIGEQIEYAVTNDNLMPVSGWVSTFPTVNQGQYLWTRRRNHYNNDTYSAWSYTVTYYGEDGSQGPQGPQGQQGQQGEQGYSVRQGQGAPSSSLGNDGDTYIDTNTGTTYMKISGSWVETGNIKGPQGDPGSDADVTWENICKEAGLYDATSKKGMYYTQDQQGNLSLLINATAGHIAGWVINDGYLSYGTLGQNNSCMISTAGLPGVVANHYVASSEDQVYKWGLTLGPNFGVTLGGNIYARSATLVNATVTGVLTATTGSKLGGFEILNGTTMSFTSQAEDGNLYLYGTSYGISNTYGVALTTKAGSAAPANVSAVSFGGYNDCFFSAETSTGYYDPDYPLPPANWVANTQYYIGDVVTYGGDGETYVCGTDNSDSSWNSSHWVRDNSYNLESENQNSRCNLVNFDSRGIIYRPEGLIGWNSAIPTYGSSTTYKAGDIIKIVYGSGPFYFMYKPVDPGSGHAPPTPSWDSTHNVWTNTSNTYWRMISGYDPSQIQVSDASVISYRADVRYIPMVKYIRVDPDNNTGADSVYHFYQSLPSGADTRWNYAHGFKNILGISVFGVLNSPTESLSGDGRSGRYVLYWKRPSRVFHISFDTGTAYHGLHVFVFGQE